MDEPEQHGELADKLEDQADAMGDESDKLESDIDDTRSQWESNKQDDRVPGAQPGNPDSDDDASDAD